MASVAVKKTVVRSNPAAPNAAPKPYPVRQPGGFDYSGEAELFPTNNRKYKRAAFGYRRFPRAAEAIRFAAQLIMDTVAKASETLGDSRTRTNRLPFQRQSSAPNRVSSRLRPSPKLNGGVCRTNPHESPFSHTSLV